jgi:cellulose synthase operon protein C
MSNILNEAKKVGHTRMWRLMTAACLIAGTFSGCSFNPNARKQKYFEDGDSFFQKGDFREAEIEFAKAIKIDPRYADAHYQLARTYLKLHEPDRAYSELVATVELRPGDYEARLAMVNLLIVSQRYHQAKEQSDLLLRTRPSDPAVHEETSALLAAQGKVADAIGQIQQSIALAPKQWEPYLSLALLQLRENQPDAAELNLKKVIALNPKAMQARLLLGVYYQSRNRPDVAEQQFRDAIGLSPNSIEPRQALAKLYLAENKYAAAEEVLTKTVHDLPHDPHSLLALSNFYFLTGKLDKSIAAYDVLYQEHPNDMQIKKKYIQLLIQTRQYDQARKLVAEILKASPADNDALLYRSQLQISDGDTNDAEQTLQIIIKNAPADGDAYYALGVAFDKQGFLDRAVDEWRQVLRINPNSLDAERAVADAAMREGEMHTLEDAATQLIRLQPSAPEGYALRALSKMNLKEYEDAEADVRRAIAVGPQSAFGYVEMGNLMILQSHYTQAAAAYEEALDRDANSIDALRGLVNTYIAQKQIDRAITVVKTQIIKSPANSGFYNLLGGLLFHGKRDFDSADAALEKSIALDQHNADAWAQLSEVRVAKGNLEQAISTAEQALKTNPRQANLYILLGELYESKSDWKQAANAYQSALDFNSQNPVASINLARVILGTGKNLDVALALAQTARRGLPDSPSVVDTLGWIYYQQGRYDMALGSLEQALRLQEKSQMPDNPDIHYHLGMAYEKAKQPALAREQFEHVLKTDPQFRGAAEIKAALARIKS